MSKLTGNQEFNGDVYLYGVGGYTGTSVVGATKLQDVIKNAENNTFIINPGVTTWQEAYDAYQAGKLVYYRRALCEYFIVMDEEIDEVTFTLLKGDNGVVSCYYVGSGPQLSDTVPSNIRSSSFEINANEVIYEKQFEAILPNGVATRHDIDSLFDEGGGGGVTKIFPENTSEIITAPIIMDVSKSLIKNTIV